MIELLHEILESLNNDKDINSTNIVEKIQREFGRKVNEPYPQLDTCKYEYELCKKEKEYDLWKESGFSLDHQFDTGTLLHIADEFGYFNIVKYLRDRGANIDIQNEQGDTPLHIAAVAQQIDTIKLLVTKGAEINIKNDEGQTPLHTVAYSCCEKTILALIKLGADPWAKCNNHITPVDQYEYEWQSLQRCFDCDCIVERSDEPGYLMKLKQAYNGGLFARYSILLLGAIAATMFFVSGSIILDVPHMIGAVTTVTAAFAAGRITYEASKPSTEVAGAEHECFVEAQRL